MCLGAGLRRRRPLMLHPMTVEPEQTFTAKRAIVNGGTQNNEW
jgi:hypothetical protein